MIHVLADGDGCPTCRQSDAPGSCPDFWHVRDEQRRRDLAYTHRGEVVPDSGVPVEPKEFPPAGRLALVGEQGPERVDALYLAAMKAYQGQCWVAPNSAGLRAAVNEAVRLTEQRLDASEDHRIAALTAERDELLAALREANTNRARMTRLVDDLMGKLSDKAAERRDWQARAESAEHRYDQVRNERDDALAVVDAAEAWLDAPTIEGDYSAEYALEAAVMAYRVKESTLTADELLETRKRQP